jgi:hypothetical protein
MMFLTAVVFLGSALLLTSLFYTCTLVDFHAAKM